MSPTPRAAGLLGLVALSCLVLPFSFVVLVAAVLVVVVLTDALLVRAPVLVERTVPSVLSRGVGAELVLHTSVDRGSVAVRQPVPPDLGLTPSESAGALEAVLTARRRGRHALPPVAVRRTGPFGLGRWDSTSGHEAEVLAYPDLPAARRLATAVRQGRHRDGARRGPLGLGTEFELVRDYVPDDDVRQVNWRATARLDRPMSNQFRVERDRDVHCVIDCGRLMAAPLGDRTRLDVALDAAVAVAAVADELGDRCGVLAFDRTIRRRLSPRRAGGRGITRAVFDLEPEPVDSDYELAFHTIGGAKRALVVLFTDLLDPASARPLLDAVPVLARRHVVVVASAIDTELTGVVGAVPARSLDVLASAVAVDMINGRAVVAHALRAAGADVVEAAPDRLGSACVSAYLKSKAAARL